jgi:hypothetical protein
MAQSIRRAFLFAAQTVGAGEETPGFPPPKAARRVRTSAPRTQCAAGPMLRRDANPRQPLSAFRPSHGEQPAEHAKRRRFPGAIGSEKAEDFAAAHLETDMIDGGEIALNIRTRS